MPSVLHQPSLPLANAVWTATPLLTCLNAKPLWEESSLFQSICSPLCSTYKYTLPTAMTLGKTSWCSDSAHTVSLNVFLQAKRLGGKKLVCELHPLEMQKEKAEPSVWHVSPSCSTACPGGMPGDLPRWPGTEGASCGCRRISGWGFGTHEYQLAPGSSVQD